jgi:hypothetical protein
MARSSSISHSVESKVKSRFVVATPDGPPIPLAMRIASRFFVNGSLRLHVASFLTAEMKKREISDDDMDRRAALGLKFSESEAPTVKMAVLRKVLKNSAASIPHNNLDGAAGREVNSQTCTQIMAVLRIGADEVFGQQIRVAPDARIAAMTEIKDQVCTNLFGSGGLPPDRSEIDQVELRFRNMTTDEQVAEISLLLLEALDCV